MNIDLDRMSLDELKSLQKRVDRAIQDFEERKRREAKTEAERVVSEYGFSMDDIFKTPMPSKKSKAPAKFRNPDNPTQTWTGRGRRPAWFTEALESGKSRDDLRI